jgi:hypothetical protein
MKWTYHGNSLDNYKKIKLLFKKFAHFFLLVNIYSNLLTRQMIQVHAYTSCLVKRLLILILALQASAHSFSQTFDVYIDNQVMTSANTFEFDVYIKSNGATGTWPLRSYQSGYYFNPVFINGGTITASYVAGSSELGANFAKNWNFTFDNIKSVLNQSANVGSACSGAPIGTTALRVLKVEITNSANWGCGDDSLDFVTSGTGVLWLSLTKYNDPTCVDLSVSDVTPGATKYVKEPANKIEVQSCTAYFWNGSFYTMSGTYTHTYPNLANCPTTDTLVLTIANGTTWTGTVSTAWENAANWSCGSVPDINTEVHIDAGAPNYPVISSIANCKKIFTAAGATLTIIPGYRLNVAGTD